MSVSARGVRPARRAAGACAAILGALLSVGDVGAARAGAVSTLILDASNSMNSPFDGGSRIEATKAAVPAALAPFADRLDLGLVVFGHREKQNCHDVEIRQTSAPGAAGKIGPLVASVTAQGVSSLAQSLEVAARSLRYRDRAATIIALADSAGVDNCRLDTCATIEQLRKESKDLVVHLIAVGAKDSELPHLRCVAGLTGGMFTRVANRGELAAALSGAFARAAEQEQVAEEFVAPPPRPKPTPRIALTELPPREKPESGDAGSGAEAADADPDGEFVDDDSEARTIAPENRVSVFAPTRPGEGTSEEGASATVSEGGSPAAETGDGGSDARSPARPVAGAGTNVSALAPTGAGDDGRVDAELLGAEAAIADAEADIAGEPPDAATDRVLAIADGDARFSISLAPPSPPGTTTLVKRREGLATSPSVTASTEATGTDDAGGTAASPAEPATGKVRLAALIVADTKPLASGVEWVILAPGTAGTPSRPIARSSEPEPEIEVPAGEYVVKATFGSAARSQRVEVGADETETLSMVLGAGGLQIDPVNAGAEEPEAVILNTIYAAGTTLSPVVRDLPSGEIVYLNAGVYRIESRYGDANAVARADIEVQPGKLVRAKINHRAGPASFRLLSEASDEPLDDVAWQIVATDGSIVAQSDEATPRIVFAEGRYEVIARRGGESFRTSFEIKPGEATLVDIASR